MMENDRHIDYRLREQVLKRDGYKCRYCGKQADSFHMDHVYPFSKGGETTYSNLVTACQRCNLKKHNSIGMWPKPLGYFDNPEVKNRHSFYITLITLFGLIILTNGVIAVARDRDLMANIMVLAGIFISFVSITANLTRPH